MAKILIQKKFYSLYKMSDNKVAHFLRNSLDVYNVSSRADFLIGFG